MTDHKTEPSDVKWLIAVAESTDHDNMLSVGMAQRILNSLAAPPADDELVRVAHDVAERLSISSMRNVYGAWDKGWFDTGVGACLDCVRYIELRGLLEHHPTEKGLVRIKP